LVEEEAPDGPPGLQFGPFDGLAVARAVAQKKAQEGERALVVRNAETGESLSRFEPPVPSSGEAPLARSVRRMRAANDRLEQALSTPAGGARGGRK
jgi:hypothetical protein